MDNNLNSSLIRKVIFEDVSCDFKDIKNELTSLSKSLFPIDDGAQIGVWVYSMANFYPLYKSILTLLKPKTICEIGLDRGNNTRLLKALCSEMDAKLHAVDPVLNFELLPDASDIITYFNSSSQQYFERKIPCDAYFIDGEHTYASLHGDMLNIEEMHKETPCIIFMHDMSWPHSYRDTIYNPKQYPHKDRPLGKGNLFPTEETFTDYGIPFEYADVTAQEGGEQNGLLLAATDFIEAHDGWEFVTIPSLFGFGIAWHAKAMNDTLNLYLNTLKGELKKFNSFFSYLEFIRLVMLAKVNLLRTTNSTNINMIASLQQEITSAHEAINKLVLVEKELKSKEEEINKRHQLTVQALQSKEDEAEQLHKQIEQVLQIKDEAERQREIITQDSIIKEAEAQRKFKLFEETARIREDEAQQRLKHFEETSKIKEEETLRRQQLMEQTLKFREEEADRNKIFFEQALKAKEGEAEQLRKLISSYENSLSWKFTAPLRKVSKFIRKKY